ncbi:MAG: hypothetical protein ACXU9Y_15920 [Gemmatimonadaceae bacterium]
MMDKSDTDIRELTTVELEDISGGWGWVDTWPSNLTQPSAQDVWDAFVAAATPAK